MKVSMGGLLGWAMRTTAFLALLAPLAARALDVNVSTNITALFDNGGNVLQYGTTASDITMTVNNATVTNVTTFKIATAANLVNDGVVITNGGQFFESGIAYIGAGGNANGNYVRVGGANGATKATWNLGGQTLYIGYATSIGNWVQVGRGGVVTNVNALTIGASANCVGNYLVITNGGQFFGTGNAAIGANQTGANANYALVGGADGTTNATWDLGGKVLAIGGSGRTNNYLNVSAGGVVTNTGAINVGAIGTGVGNYMVIANGGQVFSTGDSIINGAISNRVWIGGQSGAANATWNLGGKTLSIGGGSYMVITNSGQVYSGNFYVGKVNGDNNNYAFVGGANGTTNATLDLSGKTLYIGFGTGAGNRVQVGQGGVVTNVNALTICSSANSVSNSLAIVNGGRFFGTGAAAIGTPVGSSVNGVLLTGGGLLESTGITVGKASDVGNYGNYVTNSGGILQFTSDTPTITIHPNNAAYMDGGTLSFRGLTSTLDLLNRNTGATYEGKFTWQGANTFRLNNSALNNTTAYTFEDTADPKNYAGLDMVDGTTAITANPLTIASTGGSLLFSNTTATVSGACTVNGTMTVANSTVTFGDNLVLGEGSVINVVSTNQLPMTVSGTLTLNTATVNLPAGLAATDSFTLFTSPNNISGSVADLSVSPATHRAILGEDGKSVIINQASAKGTVIMVK